MEVVTQQQLQLESTPPNFRWFNGSGTKWAHVCSAKQR